MHEIALQALGLGSLGYIFKMMFFFLSPWSYFNMHVSIFMCAATCKSVFYLLLSPLFPPSTLPLFHSFTLHAHFLRFFQLWGD